MRAVEGLRGLTRGEWSSRAYYLLSLGALAYTSFSSAWLEGTGELFVPSSLALILSLRVMVSLDRARLRRRARRGERYELSAEGLTALNAELRPAVALCDEEGFEAELVEYDERSDGRAEPLGELQVSSALAGLSALTRSADIALEPALKLKEYLEAATLPELPALEGRAQLGLFCTREVPAGHIFLWESDLGVARSSARGALPMSVTMNRRTLYRGGGLEIFQGGGPEQRSNASILANFYWCHSESTSGSLGRNLLYPPHYFGPANCEYVTTLNSHGAPCSGLKTLRALSAEEQLLMYTGSAQSALNAQLRELLVSAICLCAPACSALPWLWLWVQRS